MKFFLSVTLIAPLTLCLWIQMTCSKNSWPRSATNDGDLWNITWAHAVNSISELEQALNSSIMFLEADISMGYIIGSSSETPIPIMAHPPATLSDLSFAEFLNRTIQANNEVPVEVKKGIKLDFKDIEAVESSLQLLKSFDLQFPVWLNADVLQGPVNSTSVPVDANRFLNLTKTHYSKAMLSLGWTTRYGGLVTSGRYEDEHLKEMADLVLVNDIEVPPTYPVRAGIVAQTPVDSLLTLLDQIPGSTYTIWGSADDPVDMDKLRGLVAQVGGHRLYIDLPFSLDS